MATRTLTLENEAYLRAEIARLGWGAAEEVIVENASECIALLEIEPFGDDAPLGASRYGGVPDLPPGVSWPKNENGQFLNFLMQVNLAEAVPPPMGEPLPARGQLYCFSGNDDFGDAIEVCAFYHDADHVALVRAALPPADQRIRVYDGFEVLKPYRLAAITVIDLPRWTSEGENAIMEALIADTQGTNEIKDERYEDFSDAYRQFIYHLSDPKGGGTAGLLCSQPSGIGYLNDDFFAVAFPGNEDDWVLLWELHSSTPANVRFCDVGYLQIYVKRGALALYDFSELRGILWT